MGNCIGLTGGIATGKSTVAKILKELGYVVIDADKISRLVCEPGQMAFEEICLAFGNEILNQEGVINRKKLGGIIFSDLSKKIILEKIVHPQIQLKLKEIIEDQGLAQSKKPWFYEAALLIETGQTKQYKQLWVTYCSEEVQLKRLMARDGVDHVRALEILKSQISSLEKTKFADFVIDTQQNIGQIKKVIVEKLHCYPLER